MPLTPEIEELVRHLTYATKDKRAEWEKSIDYYLPGASHENDFVLDSEQYTVNVLKERGTDHLTLKLINKDGEVILNQTVSDFDDASQYDLLAELLEAARASVYKVEDAIQFLKQRF